MKHSLPLILLFALSCHWIPVTIASKCTKEQCEIGAKHCRTTADKADAANTPEKLHTADKTLINNQGQVRIIEKGCCTAVLQACMNGKDYCTDESHFFLKARGCTKGVSKILGDEQARTSLPTKNSLGYQDALVKSSTEKYVKWDVATLKTPRKQKPTVKKVSTSSTGNSYRGPKLSPISDDLPTPKDKSPGGPTYVRDLLLLPEIDDDEIPLNS